MQPVCQAPSSCIRSPRWPLPPSHKPRIPKATLPLMSTDCGNTRDPAGSLEACVTKARSAPPTPLTGAGQAAGAVLQTGLCANVKHRTEARQVGMVRSSILRRNTSASSREELQRDSPYEKVLGLALNFSSVTDEQGCQSRSRALCLPLCLSPASHA